MNFHRSCPSAVRQRPRRFALVAGLLMVAVLPALGGCQGRAKPRTTPASTLLDSLLAANALLYDSVTANLGFDRLDCLEQRASPMLGAALTSQLGRQADSTVRRQHTSAQLEAGMRGIASLHPAGDAAFCRRVDSLWYAYLAERRSRRP